MDRWVNLSVLPPVPFFVLIFFCVIQCYKMGAVLLKGPKHQALQSFKGKDALSRWENLSQRGRKQSTPLFLFSLRLSSHSSIFTHMETSPLRWRASNFDLCSALMALEQWGFFSMPHQLWHGTFVCNDHLRDPVTLTPIAEHLTVGLSLPIFTT